MPLSIIFSFKFKRFDDDKLKNISYGIDQPFSTNLINILKKIEEENIILWFEDAFLAKKVNNSFVTNLVDKALSLDVRSFKIDMLISPLYYGEKTDLFGPIPRGVKYRSAIGMALYKRSTLDQLLIPGESAWELDKSTRADNLDLEFHSLNSKLRFNRPFTIINSVVKGKWIFNGPKFLKNEGLEDVIKNRGRQPIKDYLYIKLFLLRVEIFFLFKKYWYN